MNRIYRIVWNQSLNLRVAVAENSKGGGKSGTRSKLVAAALALNASVLLAQPPQAEQVFVVCSQQ